MSAKRYKERRKKTKLLVCCIIILIVIIVGIILWKGNIFRQDENKETEKVENTIQQVQDNNVELENQVDTEEETEITQIAGYQVIGKIKIPKINLEDVILEKTTDDSLNLGLTKFWGPEMNEIGNFSITGHNYKIDRSELFSKLDNIVVGDTFSLEDKKEREVTYKIYKKYTVNPKDTTPIDQNKDGKREVTLITCTKGAKERIILKAREI